MTGKRRVWPVKSVIRPDIVCWPGVMFSPAINGSDDFKMKYSHLKLTSCYDTYTVVGVNIKREMVLLPNDDEVANSSKNIPNSRRECTNHTKKWSKLIPYFRPKWLKKNITFRVAHTYIAEQPPPTTPGEKRVADYESCCLRKPLKGHVLKPSPDTAV